MLKRLREPVNGLTHLGAAVAAALGLVLLWIISRGSIVKEISLTVYGVSLILMFAASATYHLIKARPQVMKNLRKLDHSSIYLLIAGTYTPICLHYFSGFWQWGMVALIWGLALAGICVKLVILNAPRWLTAGIYLLMGWLAIFGVKEIFTSMPMWAWIWLLMGGLFFTLGAIVYITRKLDFYPGVFGFHEVWHIFVILGCFCHFIIMAAFIAPHPIVM
jgi:hemolysin III